MDDVYRGEKLIKDTYEAIRDSPFWNTSLLIITYDEHGGFFDSEAPPKDVTAPDDAPLRKETTDFDFKQLGVGVPAVVVSPLIKKGTVDHTVYDHSSVAATLEDIFEFPALTKRDAQANNLHTNKEGKKHLLTLSAARTDCPVRLVDPAPRKSAERTVPQFNPRDLDPLPANSNLHGFLAVLLKTELELSDGSDAARAAIIESFKNVRTRADAGDYAARVTERAERARRASR